MTVTADALDLLAGDPPRTQKPGDFRRNHQGAPFVAHPTEVTKAGEPKRVLYGRPSSFGNALDNSFNLLKWRERQLLIGAWIAISETRWDDFDPDDRDALDGLAARCHEAAGSSLAADRGTHVHLLCERVDRGDNWFDLILAGEALGIPEALQNRIVQQWLDFRKRLGLTALAVEQTVVNDRWRLAGTLDRLDVADHDILTAYGVLDAHCPFVGDIKTGGLTLGNDGQPNYWVKYPVQLAAYVDAVPYDTEIDERVPYMFSPSGRLPANPHIALMYHYDLARALNGEPVDWQAIPVNVDAGREGGDLCRAAADFAKRRDLFAMPAPTNKTEEPCPSTDITPTSIKTAATSSTSTAPAPTTTVPEFTSTSSPKNRSEPPRTSSPPPSPTTDRSRLRARIAGLIDQGHEQAIRRHWPADVAPLSKPGHTDDELAQILAAVRRVETEVGAAWHPDDGPPPHVNTNPRASVEYPPVIDVGGWVNQSEIDALHQAHGALTYEQGKLCAQIAKEAMDAGRSISVAASPTMRRWSLARAVIAWAASGRSVDDLWFTASLLATHQQCMDADATLGGLISQFSIEQAGRLYEAAGQ